LIKRGDTIATLNQQDAILKLEYSQTKLKTVQTQMLEAKKKLEVHQGLYEIGSIIKSKLEEIALEYENVKSQVASAEKEVAFAKQEMQKAYLTSPIDGIMGTRDVEVGEFITSTTKIGTVIDISSVYAEVGIIERDIQKVALGQEATITVDAYPNAEFKGTIDSVLPVIEGKSRTLTCKIKIDNTQGQLLPGMFAKGTIFVFGQKGAIVLPNSCLKDRDDDGTFDSLFTVDQENVAHLVDIEVGYLTTDNVVVSSGLQEGQMVVTEARGELQDGSEVEVLEAQEGLKPTEFPSEEGQQEKEMIIQ
jgi:RND family efflux transporter MFP subunit